MGGVLKRLELGNVSEELERKLWRRKGQGGDIDF